MARRCPLGLHFRRRDMLTCSWQLFRKTIEQFGSPVNGPQDRRSIGVVRWVRHALKKVVCTSLHSLPPIPSLFTLAHSFCTFFSAFLHSEKNHQTRTLNFGNSATPRDDRSRTR